MRSRRLFEAIQEDLRALRRRRSGGDAPLPAEADASSAAGTREIAEHHSIPADDPGSEVEEWAALSRAAARHRMEAEELAAQLEALRSSESYRLGHAIVRPFRKLASLRRRPARKADGRVRRAISYLRRGDLPRTQEALTIPSGTRLLGPLNDKHKTAMFLAWGLDDDALASLVDAVARLQLMLRDFKPLFVTDSDSWSAFEHYGYWFEYIPPADEWTRHNETTGWPAYVSERIGSIIETYKPARVVVYEGGPVGEALRRGVLNSVVGRSERPTEKAALLPQRHSESR